MTHSSGEWQDTRRPDRQVDRPGGGPAAAASADTQAEPAHEADFVHTEPLSRDDLDPRWWSEAADGQCGEEAAQFATSQTAPLSIV